MSTFRHLGDDPVYQGYIWNVVNGTFSDPQGELFTRDIVRSPGAVAVVPIFWDSQGVAQVVLVRQYRAAFDSFLIEVPAGMRDVAGEDPEQTARRELTEECGYSAGSLHLLHQFFPSPGMTDAVLHVYLATELTVGERQTHGPEEDNMEVLVVPLIEAIHMILRQEICDAKATIGLLLAERHLLSLDPARRGPLV